jgi:two-component system response regulator NreC
MRKGLPLNTMPRVRILLADDHTVVREGLRSILEGQPEWEVVAEAGDGREAVRQALALHPDVAVLDISMPLLNGIEATRQILRHLPNLGVLILTMRSDEAFVTSALQAGARAYLLKDSVDKDLTRGVSAVVAGKSYFSPAAAKVILDEYLRQIASKGIINRYGTLSKSEWEVFRLIAEGRSDKDVGDLLSISATTVETHRAQILQKLYAHSTTDLVLTRRGAE